MIRKYSVLICIGKFVERIGTVAADSTTERNGDSGRTCSDDEQLQGQHHALNQEISKLTPENQQFRQAGSPGPAEIATAVGRAVQTAISNANPRSTTNKVWSTSKALGNLRCSKEYLRSSLSGSRRIWGF